MALGLALDETYAIANLLFIAAEAKGGTDGISDKTLFVVAHSIMSRMGGAKAGLVRLTAGRPAGRPAR